MLINELIDSDAGTSIIIGENGSGKSTMLNLLAKAYISRGNTVIGIANSIYDKFTLRNNHFRFLGARSGRNISKNTIKKAIQNISNEDLVNLKRISQILSYVGYSGELGVQVVGLKEIDSSNIYEAENIANDDKEDIEALINKYINFESNFLNYHDNIIWIGVDDFSFERINKSIFSRLIKYESQLKKLKIIKNINIYLRKGNETIPLNQASSGELSFITSMIYLGTVIDDRTVIIIDEPENSLHPSWQKEYIGKILDLFYYYQPKVILATHSPIIVSGAESTENNVRVFKSDNNTLIRLSHHSKNFESLLWSLFGVTTPENRYMSNYFVETLNDLSENRIQLSEVLHRVSAFERSSYDEKQKKVLVGIRELAEKIQSRKAES